MSLFALRAHQSPVELTSFAESNMPLRLLLADFAGVMSPMIRALSLVILMLISGVVLTRMMVRNMLLKERTYLSALFLVIVGFGSCLGKDAFIVSVLILIIILSMDLMLSSFRRELYLGAVFNSTLFLGVAVLIYAPAVAFVPVMFVAMILFKKNWQGWAVSLAGLILPFAICSYVYWGLGYSISEVGVRSCSEIREKFVAGEFVAQLRDPLLLAFWVIVAVATIISIVGFMRTTVYIRTRPLKSFLYFIWTLLFCSILFVLPGRSLVDFGLVAVPVSVIISTYLARSSSRLSTFVFFAVVLAVVAYNLVPLLK